MGQLHAKRVEKKQTQIGCGGNKMWSDIIYRGLPSKRGLKESI